MAQQVSKEVEEATAPNQGASVFRTSCRHSRNPVQDVVESACCRTGRSSPAPSVPFWWQPTKDSKKENTSLLTLTTCTPRVRIQIVPAKITEHWERNLRDTPTFPSTMGRPRCGSGGLEPAALRWVAREVDEEAVVWRGEAIWPPEQQCIRVVGTPSGHPDFILHFFGTKSDAHSRLFQRIPAVLSPQLLLQRVPPSMTPNVEVPELGPGHF